MKELYTIPIYYHILVYYEVYYLVYFINYMKESSFSI